MTYTIIGGGAVGLVLASYLATQGSVTIVVKRQKQAQLLQQHGITCHSEWGQSIARVHATTTIPNDPAQHIFICTKAYALQTITEQLAHIEAATITACQNGLAHLALLEHPSSCAAVVEFGAYKESDTIVHHTGVGRVVIGALSGGQVPFIASTQQLPIIYDESIQDVMWRKALLNCCINPLTAIMQVKNGELITNPSLWQIVMRMHAELEEALPKQMKNVPLKAVYELCEKTAQNRSSMHVDIAHGRQTEIEEIVGAVLAFTAHPLPTLRVLYDQIIAKR